MYIYICTYIYIYLFLSNCGPDPRTSRPPFGRKRRPRAPQVSSDGPRKSFVLEVGVEDQLATLKVSKTKG